MPAGRPSKYTPEVLEKAKHYLENYREYSDEIPSIIGLAYVLELHRDTVREWGKDENKQEFSVILEKINQKQHQVLINKGLSGDFNSAIAKLALGKHGYSDKTENKHTLNIKDIESMTDEEIDAAIERGYI